MGVSYLLAPTFLWKDRKNEVNFKKTDYQIDTENQDSLDYMDIELFLGYRAIPL